MLVSCISVRCCHSCCAAGIRSRSRGARRPSLDCNSSPGIRAQGMPDDQAHPQPRAQKKKAHELIDHRLRNRPAFPARRFYDLLRALSGDRMFCHRHGRNASALSPTSRQRRGAKTTRRRRPLRRLAPKASIASRNPTFVTIAKRPSGGAGRAENCL